VRILAPDINSSQLNFSVDKDEDAVRFGLDRHQGPGEGAINAILEARTQLGGRIPTLHALCEFLDMRIANKRVFEALVKSGACDSLAPPGGHFPWGRLRAQAVRRDRRACEHGARRQRDRDLGQADLFGGGAARTRPLDRDAARGARRGPRSTSSISRRSRWDSYWTGTPSIAMRPTSRTTAPGRRPIWCPRRDADKEAEPAEGESATGASRTQRTAPGGCVGRRHRQRPASAEDAQGRPHVRLHARRRARQHRGGGVSRDVQAVGPPGRERQDAAGNRQARADDETARILASELQPIEALSERLATSVAITVTTPPT
jgi:hypothetical protein